MSMAVLVRQESTKLSREQVNDRTGAGGLFDDFCCRLSPSICQPSVVGSMLRQDSTLQG